MARQFPDYATALKVSFEEEVSGESYFDGLADQHSGRAADAFRRMAELERATQKALLPLIEAMGVVPRAREALLAEGRADALELAGQSWTEILTLFRDTYSAYVEEFEYVRAGAPTAFHDCADLLVAHEVAIIDFARAELNGEADAFKHLDRYLADPRLAT